MLFLVGAGALAIRLPYLARRPMHTDEAVHAEKFKTLLEEGRYRYDPHEYHGPTLNYFTLPVAYLSSARSFEQLNETTLRLVCVLFGAGVVFLLLGLRDALGCPGALVSALLTALSPAMVFYSRYYIQETLLVCFTFGLIVAVWRYSRRPHWGWALLAGVCLGLMHATKETFLIAAFCLAAAAGASWLWYRKTHPQTPPLRSRCRLGHLAAGLLAGVVVSVLLFSGFFQNLRGPLDSILTYKTYFGRAQGSGIHDHPWYYYLQMLLYSRYYDGPRWSEALIVALAAAGGFAALRGRLAEGRLWPARVITLYTLGMVLVYSAVPYKTPWCLLGFLHGMILLAGWGAIRILDQFRRRPGRIAWLLVLSLGMVHLAFQAWRANVTYGDDSRNPYVYSHTLAELLDLVDRLEELAGGLPAQHDLYIQVICPKDDYWPLPWYLRGFHKVHWQNAVDPRLPAASVIVIAPSLEQDLFGKLYSRPFEQRELYLRDREVLLRPNVPLELFITQKVWDGFHDAAISAPPVPQKLPPSKPPSAPAPSG
ncbi:MAG: TIGR03663 family protein [Sedimentisphaerales bacterium]|nr:TIGR03663 family protein [Sedimentisphaerales bacterium]